MSKAKLIAFDVNGTIFNDNEIFIKAINGIFPRFNKSEWPVDILREKFGQPWTSVYREVGITEDIASNDKLYEVYNELYFDLSQKNPPLPHPNLPEILDWLKDRGIILIIISSQYNTITVPLLQKYNLEKYFSEINGTISDKALAIQEAANRFGMSANEVAYIGDQQGDIAQAERAGCISIGFTGGFHLPPKIMAAKPDFIIRDYRELKDLPIFI